MSEGCEGCGRLDPVGIHYFDCSLLEPGDLLMPRGLTRAQEYSINEESLVEYQWCSCATWEKHDTDENVTSGKHGDECELPELVAQAMSQAC